MRRRPRPRWPTSACPDTSVGMVFSRRGSLRSGRLCGPHPRSGSAWPEDEQPTRSRATSTPLPSSYSSSRTSLWCTDRWPARSASASGWPPAGGRRPSSFEACASSGWCRVAGRRSRPIGPRLPRSCLCSPRAARLPPLPPSSHSPPRMAPRPRVARPNNGQRLDMAAAAPAAARRQPALPTEVACTAGAALTAACQRAGRKAACSSGSRGTRSPAIAAVGVRGQAFLTRVPLPPSELLHHQPVSLTLGSARRLPQCLPGARTQAAGLACR